MNNLRETTKTVNENGANSTSETEAKPNLTVIIGAYNFVHAQNFVQLSAEKLPETIEAVTAGLMGASPEVVGQIAEPLGKLMDAIAGLILKSQK